MACNAESRSKLRIDLKNELASVKKIFVDEHGEASFKKCVNIHEFGKLTSSKGINLDTKVLDHIGPLLICFGDI